MSALKRFLPQSMAGLVALGFFVAAAPLLLSVLLAELALNRVADHGEMLVKESVALASLSAQVRDDIVDLERSARQYIVIRDEALVQVFKSRLQRVESSVSRLRQHGLSESFGQQVDAIQAGLGRIGAGWRDAATSEHSQQSLIDDIHALAISAKDLIALSHTAVERESDKLQHAAGQARNIATVSLVALIPLTGLLAFGFTVIVTQPLRLARRGIAELGRGRHDLPITITYPREMMELGRRLDWLRQRLADLEADKDRFIRNVSHELKTPLSSLMEGIDLLAEGKMGDVTNRQMEVLDILGDSASELEQLIGNLLAYARWQSERGQSELRWFDAYPMIDAVVRVHKLSLDGRKLDVRLDLETDQLYGDAATLQEALDNLVSNAIKHTPAGSQINISIKTNGGHCRLAVRDYGRGVAIEDQLRIFDAFERGCEHEENGIRGTGIGLAIVRETAQAHGGTVEVRNAKPGAEFIVEWPVASAPH